MMATFSVLCESAQMLGPRTMRMKTAHCEHVRARLKANKTGLVVHKTEAAGSANGNLRVSSPPVQFLCLFVLA